MKDKEASLNEMFDVIEDEFEIKYYEDEYDVAVIAEETVETPMQNFEKIIESNMYAYPVESSMALRLMDVIDVLVGMDPSLIENYDINDVMSDAAKDKDILEWVEKHKPKYLKKFISIANDLCDLMDDEQENNYEDLLVALYLMKYDYKPLDAHTINHYKENFLGGEYTFLKS